MGMYEAIIVTLLICWSLSGIIAITTSAIFEWNRGNNIYILPLIVLLFISITLGAYIAYEIRKAYTQDLIDDTLLLDHLHFGLSWHIPGRAGARMMKFLTNNQEYL